MCRRLLLGESKAGGPACGPELERGTGRARVAGGDHVTGGDLALIRPGPADWNGTGLVLVCVGSV